MIDNAAPHFPAPDSLASPLHLHVLHGNNNLDYRAAATVLVVAAALARLTAETQASMQANKYFLPSAALLVLVHSFFAIGTEQLHPARARPW